MSKIALFLVAIFISMVPALTFATDSTPAPAPNAQTAPAATPTFSDTQRAEIEEIIKDYLTNKHPEVMAEGLQTLQRREQENAETKAKEQVVASKDRIFNDTNSPVGGNPKGNVTVVEFYDYQCGYCKMSEDAVERTLKEDKNVRFIYKDFPILGPVSLEAAKASLASVKQNKFQAYHDAMMGKKDHLTSEAIYQIAKDVGLDVDKLKKDMNDSALTDIVNDNLKLGQDIGVRGTPMFIINDNVFPGALQYSDLKKAVEDARNSNKS